MKPLFMWAGGKNKMLKKYQAVDALPEKYNRYLEPFMGGGAMFIWAYNKNPEAEFYVNDLNAGIMSIYEAIKNDIESFTSYMDEMSKLYLPLPKGETDKVLEKELEKDWKKLFEARPCRRYFYFRLRNLHAFEYQNWSKTREAAVLYFLMKTGFNGIWQENKNTNGRFGTPAGLLNQKDKVYDKENVMKWQKALQNCTLLSGDFAETQKYVTADSYVFLDPPYRGCFTQYGVDFDDKIQQSVIDYLNQAASKGAYAMMSNRDIHDGFFESRMENNNLLYFDVTYTAGRRKKNEDGTHSAKKAREILMIGVKQ
jgi:DNA adenine methylase